MPTLYEIDRNLVALMDSTDPETGEWKGDKDAWERLNLAREAKIENTACYIKDLRGRIITFKDEIKTLQKRQKVLESKEAWLLDNLRRSLDGQSFETARCALKFKQNPVKVQYTNEPDALSWAREYAPECIKEARPTLSAEAVKKRLLDGEAVPGAELVRETRLEVK